MALSRCGSAMRIKNEKRPFVQRFEGNLNEER